MAEGNSVRNEGSTLSAEAAEISRIVILEFGSEAKNLTPASPIPEAPPDSLSVMFLRERRGMYL